MYDEYYTDYRPRCTLWRGVAFALLIEVTLGAAGYALWQILT